MLQVSLTINTKNLWMVHFCHLLFPDYAQAVLTAQTTESTAGFPNCPKMSDEGTRCSLSFDRVRFKASVFFLLQKQRNRAELVLSVILPCLWQYLFRCNSTTKKKKLEKLLHPSTTELKHRAQSSPQEKGWVKCTPAPQLCPALLTPQNQNSLCCAPWTPPRPHSSEHLPEWQGPWSTTLKHPGLLLPEPILLGPREPGYISFELTPPSRMWALRARISSQRAELPGTVHRNPNSNPTHCAVLRHSNRYLYLHGGKEQAWSSPLYFSKQLPED